MKKHATILVVEDDAPLREAYKTILETAGGYIVWQAEDGQQALSILRDNGTDPNVILLDLRMPVLDGIGFLRQYKPAEHPNCTVVVFSNYDAHKDIDEAYSLGVDRYVLKARMSPKDLLHLIDGILND
ncbi:MAG: response regulator [Candidatus Saccharimonas aalborgensis]